MKNPFYMLNNLFWGKRPTTTKVKVISVKMDVPLSKESQQIVDTLRWVGTYVMLFWIYINIDLLFFDETKVYEFWTPLFTVLCWLMVKLVIEGNKTPKKDFLG